MSLSSNIQAQKIKIEAQLLQNLLLDNFRKDTLIQISDSIISKQDSLLELKEKEISNNKILINKSYLRITDLESSVKNLNKTIFEKVIENGTLSNQLQSNKILITKKNTKLVFLSALEILTLYLFIIK